MEKVDCDAFASIAAMNPWPCGYFGDPRRACSCAPGGHRRVTPPCPRYQARARTLTADQKNSNPSLGRGQESPALSGGGDFSHETMPAEIREQFVTLKP